MCIITRFGLYYDFVILVKCDSTITTIIIEVDSFDGVPVRYKVSLNCAHTNVLRVCHRSTVYVVVALCI